LRAWRNDGAIFVRLLPAAVLAFSFPFLRSASAETGSDRAEKRPFVEGGIYDKPFLKSAGRVSIGGYADAQFRYERVQGVLEEATFLLQRINLFTFAPVSERVRVAAEIEFEEGGGEIKIELGVIDFEIHDAFTFRGGIILSPLGRFNLAHDSPANELTDRPLASTEIIPATFSEPGMGFYGAFYPSSSSRITYEAYAVNGLSEGIANDLEGTLRIPAGKNNWEDNNARPAFVSRVALSPHASSELGVSVHTGPYNEYNVEGLAVAEERRDVTIFALDVDATWNRYRFSGEYAKANVEFPSSSGFQENQQGFYGELSGTFLERRLSRLPESHFRGVVRFEIADFDSDTDGDSHRRLTFGVNFRPAPETVFKLDWQRNWVRDSFENEEEGAAILLSSASYF
jgi:hypothetical protein